jgi:hypothetical protein
VRPSFPATLAGNFCSPAWNASYPLPPMLAGFAVQDGKPARLPPAIEFFRTATNSYLRHPRKSVDLGRRNVIKTHG